MRAPYFWSVQDDPRAREAAPLTRALLSPLAWLYGAVVTSRARRAQPVRVGAQVICVGNLTVGGVGKTPIVRALRARLAADGVRVASLSRGYGGREAGPLRVDPVRHDAVAVGDEALMLAQDGEAWIGRDRALAGAAMAGEGVAVIVMDDGFQNQRLARDLSLLAIDAANPFGNRHLLPKGPLREPVRAGLQRADAIVLVGDGPAPPELSGFAGAVLRCHLRARGALPEGRLVAFAGIGRPEKLFDSLRDAGAELADAVPFPDHYRYRARDMAFLRKLAGEHRARLITTEKDCARLGRAAPTGLLTWPVAAMFEDEAALVSLLAGAGLKAAA